MSFVSTSKRFLLRPYDPMFGGGKTSFSPRTCCHIFFSEVPGCKAIAPIVQR